jgi:DNA replication protein DnaC
MKYHETTFEDYIVSNSISSLHTVIERNYKKYPDKMEDAHNIVFYGPPGSGKYTQSLLLLKNYSPSELK